MELSKKVNQKSGAKERGSEHLTRKEPRKAKVSKKEGGPEGQRSREGGMIRAREHRDCLS